MFGQIWSTLTRKPLAAQGVFGTQLEPIVKYRLAMYLTATSLPTETRAGANSTSFRKVATPGGR